jgi:hypothetical protein
MLSQPKSAVRQQPAKLSWQIIPALRHCLMVLQLSLHPIGQQVLRDFVSLQP